MTDYTKSKIYKIIDNTTNNIYVGSTIWELDKRIKKHKRDYNRYLNGKFNFISSFEVLENDNYIIELIETYPCNNRRELMERENEHILNNKCVNRYKASRTSDAIKIQQKKDNDKYKLKNPEKYKEHSDKRNITIECCICKKQISKRNIARHMAKH